jgi:hypothetical protein
MVQNHILSGLKILMSLRLENTLGLKEKWHYKQERLQERMGLKNLKNLGLWVEIVSWNSSLSTPK